MGKVCVLASLNVDYTVIMDKIPAIGETVIGTNFINNFGGKGANQAVCLTRLGTDVNIIGKIGADSNGTSYIEHLKKEKVSLDYLLTDKEKPTGVAFINVNKAGENNIVIVPGANNELTVDEIHQAKPAIQQAKIILSQFEVPFETTVEAFTIARKKGIFTVLNPAPCKFIPDEIYPLIDLIIPNEIEMEQLTGSKYDDVMAMVNAARELIKKGVKYVVVTLGSNGSLVVSKSEYRVIPIKKVPVIDTTAAGDSFIGGAVHFLSKQDNDINFNTVLESCKFATLVAGLSIQKVGAQSSLPTYEEVLQTGFDAYLGV